ncbi:MAG TPA: sigma-70 family RNA polymerase sigma factor [Humisphaera sp.]|jgi:RNA polymerase sigma factor (TIGR02999 family)|nr:sigma-70 family RNA polymerase sigma factor [Humisphaera sp.]
MTEVTRILSALKPGDPASAGQLLSVVYEELRQLARRQMARERTDHTLQATALVHEAYLRLIGNDAPSFANRRHFFAAAAEAMRRILIDAARRKNAQRHGGEQSRVELDDSILELTGPTSDPAELLALDEALSKLAVEDPSKAELVKLRFFAGMSIEETAAVLDISRATAVRHWEYARAWLGHEMGGGR